MVVVMVVVVLCRVVRVLVVGMVVLYGRNDVLEWWWWICVDWGESCDGVAMDGEVFGSESVWDSGEDVCIEIGDVWGFFR